MSEQERLKELRSYQILDTSPEKQLDEIVEIVSTAFDVPIALISFLDDKRQWFKAKQGVEIEAFPLEQSLCSLTLQKPDELLIIEDTLKSEKSKNHSLVNNPPHLRFYAGAPLVTPKGHVIGTICMMDTKPHSLTDRKKRLLNILAESTMNYLNGRKTILIQKKNIEMSAEKLRQLTDQAPGIIFQFEVTKEGDARFPFLSKGVHTIDPVIEIAALKKDIAPLKKLIYKNDFPLIVKSISKSANTLSDLHIEFRIKKEDKVTWHLCMAKPERDAEGTTTWFGTFQDITNRVEYENTIEQISFDISHVLRRPITTLLGLSSIIENDENLDAKKLKEYSGYIRSVSDELDNFTRKLNDTYIMKKDLIQKIET